MPTSQRPLTGALLSVTIALTCIACSEPPTQAGREDPLARTALQLQAVNVEGFTFLPPLGSKPRALTDFDGSLSPVVQVCASDPCPTPVETFSVGAGTLSIDLVNAQYHAVWKTSAATVGTTYTVRVLVNDQVLGTSAVHIVAAGKKSRAPQGILAATQGSAVPISFHIRDGTVLTQPVYFQSRYWALGESASPTIDAVNSITAANYLNFVNALVAVPPTEGYCDVRLDTWENISNHTSCSGPVRNVAYKITARIRIPAELAGTWYLKIGADAVIGAAWSLDGVPQAFQGGDFYNDDAFDRPGVYLAAGTHTIVLVGFENCCDGMVSAKMSRSREDNSAYSVIPIVDTP